MHRWCRYLVFSFAAISSVLAGIAIASPNQGNEINISIIIISDLSGFVTSFEGLRKPQDLWIHERMTYLMLRDLIRKVKFNSIEKKEKLSSEEEQKVNGYFEEMQKILAMSQQEWIEKITQNGNKGDGTSKSASIKENSQSKIEKDKE